MQEEIKNNSDIDVPLINNRPSIITILCVLFVIKYLSPFILYLMFFPSDPEPSVIINWFDSSNDLAGFLVWAIRLIGLIGIWFMRKWGLWFFIAAAVLLLMKNSITCGLIPENLCYINMLYIGYMIVHLMMIGCGVYYRKNFK